MAKTALTIRLNAARSDMTVTPERGASTTIALDLSRDDHRKNVQEMVENVWRQRAAT